MLLLLIDTKDGIVESSLLSLRRLLAGNVVDCGSKGISLMFQLLLMVTDCRVRHVVLGVLSLKESQPRG